MPINIANKTETDKLFREISKQLDKNRKEVIFDLAQSALKSVGMELERSMTSIDTMSSKEFLKDMNDNLRCSGFHILIEPRYTGYDEVDYLEEYILLEVKQSTSLAVTPRYNQGEIMFHRRTGDNE